MSVLIKGLEMPESCDKCKMCAMYVLDDGTEECHRCAITMYPLYDFDKRHDSCPLIEVPTPHGRLIDADELRADVIKRTSLPDMPMDDMEWADFMFDNCFPYWQFSKAITEAPTVIEAEEANDDRTD